MDFIDNQQRRSFSSVEMLDMRDLPSTEMMSNESSGKNYKPSWLVYIASLCAHMASISFGATYGWTSAAMEEMSSKFNDSGWHSPIIPDNQQKSFIASLLTIGALFSGLFCGFFIDYFGRRKTLMGLSIPFAMGWFLIGIAKSVALIMIGRVLTGLAIGVAVAVVPQYLTEISTPNIRGYIGMSMNFFVVFGIVYLDIISICHFHWNQLAFWSLLPALILGISMLFMPESPIFCMNSIQDPEQAWNESLNNLRRLRTGTNEIIQHELREMLERKIQLENQMKSKIVWSFSSLKRNDIYKPMLIGIALLFFQQFCGINAVQFYMNDIFKTSGSSWSPKYSTLFTNCCMLLATFIGGLIIDRLGRKILLISSAFGMMVSIGTLGIYYYIHKELGRHSSNVDTTTEITTTSLLPIFCLSVFVASFSLGVGPIGWIIITEITPAQTVALITTISSVFVWIFTFIIVNETKSLFDLLAEYGTYWLFSIISFICATFVYFVLPETKGKTFEEIGNILKY